MFDVEKSEVGVWMADVEKTESVARAVAVDAMLALGIDPNDFRRRDKLIEAIYPRINGSLDSAASCKAASPEGFVLTEDELKLCAELPDALVAISDAHDAKASMAAAMGYRKSADHHAARAEELRTEAKRIEATW